MAHSYWRFLDDKDDSPQLNLKYFTESHLGGIPVSNDVSKSLMKILNVPESDVFDYGLLKKGSYSLVKPSKDYSLED